MIAFCTYCVERVAIVFDVRLQKTCYLFAHARSQGAPAASLGDGRRRERAVDRRRCVARVQREVLWEGARLTAAAKHDALTPLEPDRAKHRTRVVVAIAVAHADTLWRERAVIPALLRARPNASQEAEGLTLPPPLRGREEHRARGSG